MEATTLLSHVSTGHTSHRHSPSNSTCTSHGRERTWKGAAVGRAGIDRARGNLVTYQSHRDISKSYECNSAIAYYMLMQQTCAAGCTRTRKVKRGWLWVGTIQNPPRVGQEARLPLLREQDPTSFGSSRLWDIRQHTFSPFGSYMASAALVGSPLSLRRNSMLHTLSKHLDRWRRMSCGLEPFERMSSRSAGATK